MNTLFKRCAKGVPSKPELPAPFRTSTLCESPTHEVYTVVPLKKLTTAQVPLGTSNSTIQSFRRLYVSRMPVAS